MRFTAEVTIRTPAIEAESADEMHHRTLEGFEKICAMLKPNPPSVIEVVVYEVEDIDG